MNIASASAAATVGTTPLISPQPLTPWFVPSLTNTRSRLAHLYGTRHRFAISAPPGGGLSVVIGIPLDDVAIEASEHEVSENAAMEGVA